MTTTCARKQKPVATLPSRYVDVTIPQADTPHNELHFSDVDCGKQQRSSIKKSSIEPVLPHNLSRDDIKSAHDESSLMTIILSNKVCPLGNKITWMIM